MDVLFLKSIFQISLGLKMSFEHKSARKNLFLSACFCWDSRLSLREMDQKFRLGGSIGYGDSYLEFLFPQFKVFRLHGFLHAADGAVRAHSGKGRSYCYLFGRGPNSCSLSHVTGLISCLYKKVFLPFIFNPVDFWSSISCIVLDIELTYINVFRDMGVFIDGKVQGYSFRPPKDVQTQKTSILVHKQLARNCVEQWTFWLQWALKQSS